MDEKRIPLGNAVDLKNMMLLKEFIKMMCERHGITIKEFTQKIGMNETAFHDRFKRKTISVADLDLILSPFGLKLKVVDMTDREFENRPIKLKDEE